MVERARSTLTRVNRRHFLITTALALAAPMRAQSQPKEITVFLCGDVMTGRGVDQILPRPGNPELRERYVADAKRYVELAEQVSGPIAKPVDYAYIWGDALDPLRREADVRMINLETSITTSERFSPNKAIHYKMHPENISCITLADIDCCVLANNHVLDFGQTGLSETLMTLERAGVQFAGAGRNAEEAAAPVIVDLPGAGRVLVFAYGSPTAGVPLRWAASADAAGVNLLRDLGRNRVRRIAAGVHAVKRPGDIAIASIHWGRNWGYHVERDEIAFAHQLIDDADIDIVHGHSSHHPKAVEVYRGLPIIYGCGDFINDYEGIPGYEEYRGDLALMYFVTIDPLKGTLARLKMIPMQIRALRLQHASQGDSNWLATTLSREGKRFGTRVEPLGDNALALRWHRGSQPA